MQAFRWDKCYLYHDDVRAKRDASPDLKAAFERCNAWFREEECLYECDVNAGKWRKHGNCKDDKGASNEWQVEGMPIRASECDAFYAACRDLVVCACSGPDCPADGGPKSLFGLAFADDRYCKNETTYCQKTVGEVCVLCCMLCCAVAARHQGLHSLLGCSSRSARPCCNATPAWLEP